MAIALTAVFKKSLWIGIASKPCREYILRYVEAIDRHCAQQQLTNKFLFGVLIDAR
jgi:hypothetical protein